MHCFFSMEERNIVWDGNKNAENKLKHKIGFEKPSTFLSIQIALNAPIGAKAMHPARNGGRLWAMWGSILIVVHVEREEGTRLITARKAEKHERRSYNGYYQIDGKGWAKAT